MSAQLQELPRLLYVGTSSLYLSSILNTGISPLDTYAGKIVLTSDPHHAAQLAIEQANWHRNDSGLDLCQRMYAIYPIVCAIDAHTLVHNFIVPHYDQKTIGYTAPIRVDRTAITQIPIPV